MEKYDKLCVICCIPFVSNDEQQNEEKISEFCEQIKNNVDNNGNSEEIRMVNKLNCGEELSKLENRFGISICYDCSPEITELLTSKQNMRQLEDQVLSLQMEILEGLRNLENCMDKIKCHKQNIKKTVKCSDELPLKSRLNSETESNCFALQLRQWIIKDAQQKTAKVKGNLWIPGSEEQRTSEQTIVKVEPEETSANFDDDWGSNHSSLNTTDDVDKKPVIKVGLPSKSSKSRISQVVQVRKTSTMTLRRRSSRKVNVKITSPNSSPILPLKPKRKKVLETKIASEPVLKKRKKGVNTPRLVRHCDLCSFKTKVVPSFEQHMRHHENEADLESKSLQCTFCPSKFSTKQYFNFHQICHQGSYKLSCDICSKMIPALSLEDHLKSHIISEGEKNELKIIYCQNCSFCCTSRQTYLTHLHRHKSKTTKGKFSCDICSETFSMPKNLRDHLIDKHEEAVAKIPCDFPNCGKIFTSQNYLSVHKWIHSERKLSCQVCDMKFLMKCHLEQHSRTHSDEKPFVCNLCNKRFRWKGRLLGHQRIEHDICKLKCEICDKKFGERRRLNFHMKDVHGNGNERFPCKICGKTLKRKENLKIHLLTHEKDNKFSCDQCGKGFNTEVGLKGHLKVHRGVKDWNCEYCGKAFLRKENLRDHLRVHTGERPFVCEICGKDFNQASALKTHKKNQHPN